MLNLTSLFPTQLQNECVIRHISTNSQEILPQTLFVALKGLVVDGHNYVQQAFDNGALVAIVERKQDVDGLQIVVEDCYDTLSYLCSLLYPSQSPHMKIIGITGTDGKTSTATIIYKLFMAMQQKCGYIGTNGIMYEQIYINLGCTTPLAPDVHQLLARMLEHQIQYVAMEVSSHALATKRVEHLKYEYAVFTNLTHDHLDFHKTFSAYRSAKCHLFELLTDTGKAIINADDPEAKAFMSSVKPQQIFTYAINEASAHLVASNIEYTVYGTKFTLTYQKKNYPVISHLIGSFNVYNMLAAIAILICEGYAINEIISTLLHVQSIDGRMEILIHPTRELAVIVDFAHAPNALEKVITFARQLTEQKIIVVTGAVGDGDVLKRPIMGKLCSELADFTFFTTDEPYSEEPEQIITEMLSDVTKDNYKIIIDRQQAITMALERAQKDDIILILGRGKNAVIPYHRGDIHFNDYEFVTTYMETTNQ